MARNSRHTKAKPKRTVFYVAMEGSVTERKYFDALIRKHNLRNVRLLKKRKTRSSPLDVVKRLEQQMRTNQGDHGNFLDERYWAVFDTDRRPTELLRSMASRAGKKKICLAPSNPCFELWLIFHFGPLTQMRGLQGGATTHGCGAVSKYLQDRFDSTYDKSAFDPEKYIEKVDAAVSNAHASDTSEADAWTKEVGTHVYKLVESIRNTAT